MTAEAAELTAARKEVMRLRVTTKRPRCTDMPGPCSADPPPRYALGPRGPADRLTGR
jgi:hypothetical protein